MEMLLFIVTPHKNALVHMYEHTICSFEVGLNC